MEKWSLTPAGSLLVLVRWMHIIKTGREKKKEKEKKTGNKQTNKQKTGRFRLSLPVFVRLMHTIKTA